MTTTLSSNFGYLSQLSCIQIRCESRQSTKWLHSTSKATRQAQNTGLSSSRRKLAIDLTPTSRRGHLEIAPRRRPSERDSLRHKGYGGKPEQHNISYRRRSEWENMRDWESRTGRWGKSPENREQIHRMTTTVSSSKRDRGRTMTMPVEKQDIADEQDEFYHPPTLVTASDPTLVADASPTDLPKRFTSPPLLPGLIKSLKTMIGPDGHPTPIQSLSLKWLFDEHASSSFTFKQFLLASETGSGKSIAYLLPVIQALKQAELNKDTQATPAQTDTRRINPRGLVIAPTHELSRQLSSFAKALSHDVKLRILCSSRANMKNTKERDLSASEMLAQFDTLVEGDGGAEFQVTNGKHPVDLVVGTPMKIMEMVRGRGWDKMEGKREDTNENDARPLRRGRDKMVGFGKWRSKPEMGLANIEWVVVDEADVLFDPDFQEVTRTLLADISAARGNPVPILPFPSASATPSTSKDITKPIDYPFNLILISATIPSSLALYLNKSHPKLIRLASPRLHHLPKSLQTEYVGWTGGNKFADVEKRLRKVWAEDAVAASTKSGFDLSKVLIFCNKSVKVVELSAYLNEKGIKNVALTSAAEERRRGSNKHLDGFLRPVTIPASSSSYIGAPSPTPPLSDLSQTPHVMITTSLLSRGLDFSPSIKHIFIVDEPRNMIDFLHRAGRSGRAGQSGRVVIFGKMEGRGSDKTKEVRHRVKSLLM